MHTPNLARTLRSFPIDVRFAGFKSDTLKLAQAGWDLSMMQNMDMRRGEPTLQLAMNFDCNSGGGYRAISNPLSLEHGLIRQMSHESAMRDNEHRVMEILSHIGFDLMYIGEGGGCRFRIFPIRAPMGFSSQFEMIDPVPQEVEESLADFKFFKVASKPTVKDLIVAPRDVPALLDAVMRAQRPLMDKIKARERSRENFEHMRNDFRPRSEVAFQVLALAE